MRPGTSPTACLDTPSMSKYDTEDDSSDVECPTCGERFSARSVLGRHHNREHGCTLVEQEADGPDCPTCDRSDFTSWKAMAIHHAKVHGEVLDVEVECAWCGAEKTVTRHEYRTHDRHFCGDDDCLARWRSECRSGEDSPHWGGRVTVHCSHCGDDIHKIPSLAESRDWHFCNRRCYANWLSENRSGEDSPHWNGGWLTVQCAHCGDDVEIAPHTDEIAEKHFCKDGECFEEWYSENFSGEDSPHWNGGTVPYGGGWTDRVKEPVRERQNRKCAGCGTHTSEFPERLSVHHIQKARTFDDDDARHDDLRLVALCRSCHPTWETMSPLRPQTPHLD